MFKKKPGYRSNGAVIDLRDREGNRVAPAPRMTGTAVIAAANRVARAVGRNCSRENAAAVEPVGATEYAGEPRADAMATIADLVGADTRENWQAFVADRIATWAERYFDEGEAGQRSPWRGASPYTAWRGEAELDRTPEILGLKGFRGIARTLPREADALLLRAAHDLGLRGASFDTYLRHLLQTVAGWAGHARSRGVHAGLAGHPDSRVREVLAIRAAWDLALLDAYGERCHRLTQRLRERLVQLPSVEAVETPPPSLLDAFIAAPLARARELGAGERANVHAYDWKKDSGAGALEHIIAARLASAYRARARGSASNNDHPGRRNDAPRDGRRSAGGPLHFNAFIEAPLTAIEATLQHHRGVRELADHGEINLFAILDEGRTLKRYRGVGHWSDVRPLRENANVFDAPRERRSA